MSSADHIVVPCCTYMVACMEDQTHVHFAMGKFKV